MLAAQSTEIGGRKYTVNQLPAMQAVRLLPRIGKAIGPVLGRVLSAAAGGGGLSAALGKVDAGAAFATLFDTLTSAELEYLTRELLVGATVEYTDENGRQTLAELLKVFDVVMAGRIGDVFKVLFFAFKVNYANFSLAPSGM